MGTTSDPRSQRGSTSLNGNMVEEPVIARAREILKRIVH